MQKNIYNAVYEGLMAGIACMRPGQHEQGRVRRHPSAALTRLLIPSYVFSRNHVTKWLKSSGWSSHTK